MSNTVKPLFSDHYLTHRIQETSEWNEDLAAHFQQLQNFYQQKQDILSNLNESQTENEWIQPILKQLDFSYIVQTSLHKSGKVQRPDYSLFLNKSTKQDAYNLGDDETDFYSRVSVIADAKYYERPLSEKVKNDQKDTFKNSNPSFQIVNYLDGTRVDWGMLTNGRYWRLYYRLSSSPIQQFYEIDLVKILLDNDLEAFKYFWLFFRKEAFIKDSQNLNFLERVREESTSYARQIEDSLKKLVFNQVFANLAGGFVAYISSSLPVIAREKTNTNQLVTPQINSPSPVIARGETNTNQLITPQINSPSPVIARGETNTNQLITPQINSPSPVIARGETNTNQLVTPQINSPSPVIARGETNTNQLITPQINSPSPVIARGETNTNQLITPQINSPSPVIARGETNTNQLITPQINSPEAISLFVEITSGGNANFLQDLQSTKPPRNDNNKIYQATLSFLYKILFLLYAEAKNLLPIEQESYREYSLSFLLKNIAKKCDQQQTFSETSTQYYDRLLSLFRIIDKGDKSLNVPAYNGGLFKVTGDSISLTNQFLLQYKLTDHILAPALDQLARIKGEPIDYKFLGVRDLGTIYEGLLEYKLVIDDAETGKVHLENDKGERRETGSYYTPEYIVNYIVQNTLDPILEEREIQFQALMTEINQLLKELQDSRKAAKTIQLLRKDLEDKKRKAYETLLDIKVCDPAMGSGHFLVTTVDYITRKLINILNNYPENNPILEQLERIKEDIINNLTKQEINVNSERLSPDNLLHRAVMKRCIYGVDLNPMAVELAKVSLWLHSFTIGAPLSFLDHHLRCGNSLIGCMAKDVQNEFISADATEGFLPLFQTPFHGLLQSANVMQEIANLSDATFEQVEQSQHYFNSFDEQAKPYKKLLDVYICQYFGFKKKEVNSFFRFRLNDLKAKVNKADEKLLETARKLYEEKQFFHWDLEFPEVFIDLANADWKENGGFDVVLGNPPYGDILDKKSKEYLITTTGIKTGGRAEIYSNFMLLATVIARRKGYLSFIIPNTCLDGYQFTGFRKAITNISKIIEIVDYRNKKVFDQADVITMIIVLEKCLDFKTIFYLTKYEVWEEEKTNFNSYEMKILINSEHTWRSFNPIISKIEESNTCLRLEPDIGTCHDAGVDYKWKNVGWQNRGKKVSLSELLFYYGEKRNSQDYLLLKGENLNRYSIEHSNNYLIYDFKKYKNPKTVVAVYLNLNLIPIKILTRQTSDSIQASVDCKEFITSKSIHTTIIKKENYSAWYIVSILNSKLLTYIYQSQTGEKDRTFAQVKLYDLRELPIRKISFTTPQSDRTTFLNQLTQTDYTTMGQDSSLSILNNNRQDACSTIIKTIQQHLQQNQTDVIHDFLAYLAEQMMELNKHKQTESKDFLTWLTREIGTEIDNLTNKTAIKNYLGDYQKKQTHLTFEQFLDILKKNRKKLTIEPSERQIQNLLAKEYEASLNTLLPIKQKLQYTDNLIDQIVYQLYSLTHEEIAIIEGKLLCI